MQKIKLAIIFGGSSSEYSVSLHSASSAISNVDENKYDLTFIGISKEGAWYYYGGTREGIEHDTWQSDPSLCPLSVDLSGRGGFIKLEKEQNTFIKVDCVFPILHGKNGEDGTLQGLLTLAKIPFVGCDALCSSTSMDKQVTHIICEAAGIKMAPYMGFLASANFDYEAAFKQLHQKITFPAFVKPANAGSSYGITKIKDDYNEFKAAMLLAFKHDCKVIVETGIDGFEVGTAVMGNDYDNLTVGEIDQILTENDFFDFEAKYALQNTKIVCPAHISEDLTLQIKTNARSIYKAMGCSGMSRIDMFVASDGQVYFNELNTIPGFTTTSRYPSMMQAIGIDFSTLIDRLVALALE